MDAFDEFMASQKIELAQKIKQLEALEKLGSVPGISPNHMLDSAYGWYCINARLVDPHRFIAWAKINAVPVYEIKVGGLRTFWPEIPNEASFAGATKGAVGDLLTSYSTWFKCAIVRVFAQGFELLLDIEPKEPLKPRAKHAYTGGDLLPDWSQSGCGVAQGLQFTPDRKECVQTTLLRWDEFERIFGFESAA